MFTLIFVFMFIFVFPIFFTSSAVPSPGSSSSSVWSSSSQHLQNRNPSALGLCRHSSHLDLVNMMLSVCFVFVGGGVVAALSRTKLSTRRRTSPCSPMTLAGFGVSIVAGDSDTCLGLSWFLRVCADGRPLGNIHLFLGEGTEVKGQPHPQPPTPQSHGSRAERWSRMSWSLLCSIQFMQARLGGGGGVYSWAFYSWWGIMWWWRRDDLFELFLCVCSTKY